MLSRKVKQQVHPRIRASLSEQFTAKEMVALGKFGTIVDVSAGRTLTSLGEPAREAMLVIEGGVKVRSGNSISLVRNGGFFGALDPSGQVPQSGSSVSSEDTSVLVFSSRDFDALLHVAPSLKSAVSATPPPSEEILDLTDRRPTPSVATHRLPTAA